MSIEINGHQGHPPVELTDTARKTAGGVDQPAVSPTPTASSPAISDTLSLTNEAAKLKALEAEIADLPVVDTQRVQDVQRSLATGSYEIEPARVADKLLRFEAGLAPA